MKRLIWIFLIIAMVFGSIIQVEAVQLDFQDNLASPPGFSAAIYYNLKKA